MHIIANLFLATSRRLFSVSGTYFTRLIYKRGAFNPKTRVKQGSNKGILSIRYEPFVDLVDKAKEMNAQV